MNEKSKVKIILSDFGNQGEISVNGVDFSKVVTGVVVHFNSGAPALVTLSFLPENILFEGDARVMIERLEAADD